jgi:hypothetical protein
VSRKKKKHQQPQPQPPAPPAGQEAPQAPAPDAATPAPVAARFPVGSAVRVKTGTVDPDFPDMPLSGWSGAVTEVDLAASPPLLLIEWDDATLERMPEETRRHLEEAEEEDLDPTCMWLGQDDLEPHDAPATPETPAPQPAGDAAADERVRQALGVPAGQPLPPADPAALRAYHAHLTQRLTFPFAATFWVEGSGQPQGGVPVTVRRLLPDVDEELGLLVEAEHQGRTLPLPLAALDADTAGPTHELVSDYALWFWESRLEDEAAPMTPGETWRALLKGATYAAGAGASLGAVLAVEPFARTGMLIGMALLGLLGYVVGGRSALLARQLGETSGARAFGGILGALFGAFLGGVLGILVLNGAVLGTVPGAILGSLLGRGLAALKVRPLGEVGSALLGAFCGAAAYAFWDETNREAALGGALVGAAICGGVVFLVPVLVGLAGAARRR